MALFKSNILAQVSGSMNGIVFSRNAGGAYMRNRSIPTNPGTDRQDQVRTALTSLATAWPNTLTETQRILWNAYGAGLSVKNKLGDTIKLSGIAAFQRVNLFRMSTLGEAPLLDPPAAGLNPDAPPAFLIFETGSQTPSTDVTALLTLDSATTGYSVAVYYSGNISRGINYFRGPYIGHFTTAVTTNEVVLTFPLLQMPATGDGPYFATKITLYETSTGLPVWTINTDPSLATV